MLEFIFYLRVNVYPGTESLQVFFCRAEAIDYFDGVDGCDAFYSGCVVATHEERHCDEVIDLEAELARDTRLSEL